MMTAYLIHMLIKKGFTTQEVLVAEILFDDAPKSKVIAERLGVTEKTVKWHLGSMYKKLGVKSRSEFIVTCHKYVEAYIKESRA